MISSASLLPERRMGPVDYVKRGLAAAMIVAVFLLAYGGTLAAFLQQGAPLAQPGDRLLVVFPPEIETGEALQRIGDAGAVLTSSRGTPYFYPVDIVARNAGEQLAREGWAMRVPIAPTLQGCFNLVSDRQ